MRKLQIFAVVFAVFALAYAFYATYTPTDHYKQGQEFTYKVYRGQYLDTTGLCHVDTMADNGEIVLVHGHCEGAGSVTVHGIPQFLLIIGASMLFVCLLVGLILLALHFV